MDVNDKKSQQEGWGRWMGRELRPLIELTPDLACLQLSIVNVYFVGTPGASQGEWVLVDAGLGISAGRIESEAAARFGDQSRPAAIILTHGHFDHVGALDELLRKWPEVPVYAHELEMPYLTGKSSYPPPDPSVGGGAMSIMAPLYPRGPIDLNGRVQLLPEDLSVPGMPGWRWIATPGHSPGHVSLFRDSDRALIAGDAFVTTRQESLIWVLTQREKVSRPPAYYTVDWQAARESIEKLAQMEPEIAATGHGRPMTGELMRSQLKQLIDNFDREAIPARGRYVSQPARANEEGVLSIPPPVAGYSTRRLMVGAGVFALGMMAARLLGGGRRTRTRA